MNDAKQYSFYIWNNIYKSKLSPDILNNIGDHGNEIIYNNHNVADNVQKIPTYFHNINNFNKHIFNDATLGDISVCYEGLYFNKEGIIAFTII